MNQRCETLITNFFSEKTVSKQEVSSSSSTEESVKKDVKKIVTPKKPSKYSNVSN